MAKAYDKLRDRAPTPGLGVPIRCSNDQWPLLPLVLSHTLCTCRLSALRPVGLFPGAAAMPCSSFWIYLNGSRSPSHEPVIVAWSVLLMWNMAWLPGYREYLGGGPV